MKKAILLICILNLGISNSFCQNKDSLRIEELGKKVEQIEKENLQLKAKVEAYKENSSDMLDAVSISIAILLGVFVFVNISQLVVNYRTNKNKLKEIENGINEKVSEAISKNIKNKNEASDSRIKGIWTHLNKLELMIHENRIRSITVDDVNIELLNLATLLPKAYKYYEKTGDDKHLGEVIDGVIRHLEEHSTIMTYERERIYDELKEVKGVFELRVKKIIKLMEEKG